MLNRKPNRKSAQRTNYTPVGILFSMICALPKALTYFAIIQVILNPAMAAGANADNRLIASLPLNGNTLDVTGNGNDALSYGTPLGPNMFGQPNSAYYFTGLGSSYMEGPADRLPAGERTTQIAFKIDKSSPNFFGGFLFGYGGGPTCGTSWVLDLNNKCNGPTNNYEVQAHCNVNRVEYNDKNMELKLNDWHLLTVTTSVKAGTSIYLNDTLVVNRPDIYFNNTAVAGTKFGIGTTSSSYGRTPYSDSCATNFKGWISCLKIWNYARTPEEIQQDTKDTFTEPSTLENYQNIIIPVATSIAGFLTGIAGTAYCFWNRNKNQNAAAADVAANRNIPLDELRNRLIADVANDDAPNLVSPNP